MDLALADFLLTCGLAASVELNLKPQHFYVSDAMPKDVLEHIEALSSAGALSQALGLRLGAALRDGRLRMRQHWFCTTCLLYYQLPDDLRRSLSLFDLVIFKGDANYRRLVGDFYWDSTTPFADVVGYFPAPLAALRVLKAEVVVGLPPGKAGEMDQADRDWMINGKWGVIQFLPLARQGLFVQALKIQPVLAISAAEDFQDIHSTAR